MRSRLKYKVLFFPSNFQKQKSEKKIAGIYSVRKSWALVWVSFTIDKLVLK